MSRSRRRRKDRAWCRGCDSAMVDRDGRGNCQVCKLRELRERGYLLSLGPLTMTEADTPTGRVWRVRQTVYALAPRVVVLQG